ncbi:hypothetical protein BgAZ_208460 [Babesia gibsoni]|uniref:Uncharacterized protein n=1 Tax=Babesia gibsoni TaxID=33632 RepID=A0AAD8PEP8_BABGI|nr:hypothetical protein BgAZ_208460 [Babesia gibsoni]
MTVKLLAEGNSRYGELCREFIKKLVNFGVQSCSLSESRNPNRVDLKKALLEATRGRSISRFISFLGMGEKQRLKAMMHMECPVICPSRKTMLRPVESMPRNIMKSAKKLRNFFGIPEAQVCRGCVKRVRCRHYQQVERDVPDLSDIAAIFIGLHTTCKLKLKGSDIIVEDESLSELPSAISVLESMSTYFKTFPRVSEYPRGDEQKCKAVLRKHMKMRELRKLELQKEKILNIPKDFNVMPSSCTYMTGFQRELYYRLQKGSDKKTEDCIWVEDAADATLEENKDGMAYGLTILNSANFNDSVEHASAIAEKSRTQELDPSSVQFRMEYSTPVGGDVNLVRYDILNDKFIQGIKVNNKGRVIIDIEKHASDSKGHGGNSSQGIPMYRPVSVHKSRAYADFLKNIPSGASSLKFLKKVPYNYHCQSSGECLNRLGNTAKDEATELQNIAMALASQQN